VTGVEARIPRAFAGAEIGDRRKTSARAAIGGSVSNADFPISGIYLGASPRPVRSPRKPVSLASRRQTSAELMNLWFPGRRVADRRRVSDQAKPSCFSCSAQTVGRLRASRVTVRSAGARPSAIATMMRGAR
jgi:hypothetical protein